MIRLDIQGKGPVEAEHGVRIGREPKWADVVLDRASISRHHMEIRPEGAGYRVFDMGSQNGTMVNAQPVGASGRLLDEGDQIIIGGVVEVRVIAIRPPETARTTVARHNSQKLSVQFTSDQFIVEFVGRHHAVRDAMPFQLGLALSMLVLYQRDRLGPVPDVDMRAIVWRGDAKQKEQGDINRLLLRLRSWFRSRDVEPPTIKRPKRAGSTWLQMPVATLEITPDDWLYKFLDGR